VARSGRARQAEARQGTPRLALAGPGAAWDGVLRRDPEDTIVKMSETDLQKTIIDACKIYGFRVSHFRPAKTERGWRTPVQGDAGFPDLAIAGHGHLLLVELKIGKKQLRPDQGAWRDAIPSANYRLWTDLNLPEALAELRAISASHPATGIHGL
jgi:hypothetical protein